MTFAPTSNYVVCFILCVLELSAALLVVVTVHTRIF